VTALQRIYVTTPFLMVLFASLTAAPPAPQTSPQACPGQESATAREAVDFFVSSRGHANTRARYELPSDLGAVRRLVNPGDIDVCRQLYSVLAEMPNPAHTHQHAALYQVGDFYFVLVESRRPGKGRISTGWQALHVFDGTSRLVASIAV
jgi:hypothetical protein